VSTTRCQVRALPSPHPGPGQGQDPDPDPDPGLLLRRIQRAPLLEVRVAVALNQYPEGPGLALSPGHQTPGRGQDLALGVHAPEAGQEIGRSEEGHVVDLKIKKGPGVDLKFTKGLAVDLEIIKEVPLCAEGHPEEVPQEEAHQDVGPQEIGHEGRQEEDHQEEVLLQGGPDQEADLEPRIWMDTACTWQIWTAMRPKEI